MMGNPENRFRAAWAHFDPRQGRNQTFNSAGNVVAAVSMGLIAYCLSDRGIFFFVFAFAIPTLIALRMIDPKDIDYDLARGRKTIRKPGRRARSAYSKIGRW
jgi:hypothetical protein